MSKFKKGDKVENDVYKGVIVCEHEGGWLVDLGKLGYHLELDGDLRPVQLICDKAREKLHTTQQYKVKVNSDSMLAEFDKYRKEWTGYLALNTHNCTDKDIAFFENYNVPELNLKTGEVIPFVDVTIEDKGTAGPQIHAKPFPSFDDLKDTSDAMKATNAHLLLIERDREITELKENFNKLKEAIIDSFNTMASIK